MTDLWVAVNQSHGVEASLHIDPDCRCLSESRVRQVSRSEHPHKDVCDVCSEEWSAYDDPGESFDCGECGRSYATSGGLGRHVMREHPEVVEASLETDSRKVTA